MRYLKDSSFKGGEVFVGEEEKFVWKRLCQNKVYTYPVSCLNMDGMSERNKPTIQASFKRVGGKVVSLGI